jgi:hypothetical protein
MVKSAKVLLDVIVAEEARRTGPDTRGSDAASLLPVARIPGWEVTDAEAGCPR